MGNTTSLFWERYHKTPIVGIIRGQANETVLKIAEAFEAAGFTTLEVTMNTAGAAAMISTLRSKFPSLNVGAGTVCKLGDLREAIDAGAQFIVTPIIDETVIEHAVDENIPIFPGAFSPTEIYKAWSLGASAVKVFPATKLGVDFIKDVLGPLDKVKLLPTGGVSKSNIRSFFEAGAFGVGMGSSLIDKKLVTAGDYEGLKKHFESVKDEVADFIRG
ncbi:2-dehydro-3-deoxyphosphogluconate aldolase/(4S)-4-hydroxy-2-oxoglutarate aldolase [Algoriphagus ratkowskyi]|uniref:2-dehydro-3-deoxyphosphogluconate aldolase/(4S)-4-hydroxy-2-oxoglutarate aldolase n=1 Tax=Algoriphagus ratkowskyi TaxID=57028 RepID=A0A2W7QYV9_9BACT|nr:bifunctional 4-hydroxy-2-oxoglutarate aldolase/2-dehydro-3-deoxy-phosphogluconate aldolase [Algoriphagus ratkowskyi]PZX53474.1 2-dehydro-3-deoxyphosphogluconate aldolase/(4S)-4-hydroxy-2-oxoglutarate aldolase [Algoriphagus ratkowskyi]TXD76490.1 bifunctional 4-hydroxy-2-oxoglutarate aldolase/2-dehydro-3-deoxy-phosphogluconate aldolase [Algoriphagus ratkowskyi]